MDEKESTLYTEKVLTEFWAAFLDVKGGFLLLTCLLSMREDPHPDTLDLFPFPSPMLAWNWSKASGWQGSR